MIISLILAMDEDCGIGRDNQIPWHLSADLRRFKRITMGHCVLMGRKTYDSIGRPLPGRISIVITQNKNFQPSERILRATSLENALQTAQKLAESEAFIIGGGEIFQQGLPLADQIYLTRVHTHAQADVFFNQINPDEWLMSEEEFVPADDKNQFDSTFALLKRKN